MLVSWFNNSKQSHTVTNKKQITYVGAPITQHLPQPATMGRALKQQQLNQGRYSIHVGTFSSFRAREIAVNKNKFVKYIAHGRDVIKTNKKKEICGAKAGKSDNKVKTEPEEEEGFLLLFLFLYKGKREIGTGREDGLARVTFSKRTI